MKALSLTQPWATLVALDAKHNETRSWPTRYRGWLAIHAAKGLAAMDEYDLRDLCQQEPFHTALSPALPCLLDTSVLDWRALPRGAVVAVTGLIACVRITPDYAAELTAQEAAFGNYTPGRWAWHLGPVLALPEPIPARGMQGLWDWDAPPTVLALLEGR